MGSAADKIVYLKNHLTSSLRFELTRFSQMLGQSHKGKRNIYDVYGYEQNISFETMFLYARREGIANLIAFGIPKTCWRNGFSIIDLDTDKKEKILEDEINSLNKSGMVSKLESADVLNRIGNFSVLFVGVPDGRQSEQPLGTVTGDKLDQVYFKPFGYDGIQVTQFVTDTSDPRFGLPKMYQVSIMNRGTNQKDVNMQSMNVHWSRIVHLNENALDSDVEGMPALAPVFNRILDIDKTIGGAAEAYYRNASPKYTFEIDPEFGDDFDDQDKKDFDEAASKFTNDWQNMIRTVGTKVNQLDTLQESPLDTVKVALWEIAGNTGIPLRKLTGEGTGQLAGSEDRLAYNAVISDRQTVKCSPWVERVLEILRNAGMLELPETYSVAWPKEEAHTEQEQAKIQETRAKTLEHVTKSKANAGGDSLDLKATAEEFGIVIKETNIE